MSSALQVALDWTEAGLIPDQFIRAGIRRLLRDRLRDIHIDDCEMMANAQNQFVSAMDISPTALETQAANAQHYEIPAEFFHHVLGVHKKYSSCYWPVGINDLDCAEAAALEVTSQRAGLLDGQRVLELGCGWGSLTLWMAERFPTSAITAVSNSTSQRKYIESQAAQRGLGNVKVVTCDMNEFTTEDRFDRVVSIEMFEHMRNWHDLYARIHSWLVPGGLFFKHIFCHRQGAYEFLDQDPNDWMSRHFFTGGIMPSDDLPLRFQEKLQLLERWRWNGTHYQKTAEAWLKNMEQKRDLIWPILEQTYGPGLAKTWWSRWRIFFMACAELFGYDQGQHWWVSHYLFTRKS